MYYDLIVSYAQTLATRIVWAFIATASFLHVSIAAAEEAEDCFDVALVARVAHQRATELPSFGDEEEFVITHWPWLVDLDVEAVYVGREPRSRLRVTATLHNGFNQDIDHFLFLLRRAGSTYVVVDTYSEIVADRWGRFVMPLHEPIRERAIAPHGWVREDYEQSLKPVSYRHRDAWWLRPPYLRPGNVRDFSPDWVDVRGDHLRARRGIHLRDLADVIALPRCTA